MALLVGIAQAQDPLLEVVYVSPPATEPFRVTGAFQGGDDLYLRFDANGDGQGDLVMTRRNARGDIDGVLVVDVATREEIWRMEVETEDAFAGQDLFGFVRIRVPTPTVSVHTFALFAGGGSLQFRDITDGTSNTFRIGGDGVEYEFVGATDFDGDGLTEIATYRSDPEQVEVWSSSK
jgi:hypothetical protein